MRKPNLLEAIIWGPNPKRWSDLAHRMTGGKFLPEAKPDVSTWSRTLHEVTSWLYYKQPEADKIAVWKVRNLVNKSRAFDWAEVYQGVITEPQDPSTANRAGVGGGQPMQRGTDRMRSITYGRAHRGEQQIGQIPLPESGEYWLAGAPTPSYDRGAIIVAPDGVVYEVIQLDPYAPVTVFSNQAYGLGVFKDGQLVTGRATGAGGVPNSAFLWDRSSSNHTQSLILFDYHDGDGLLPATIDGHEVPWVGAMFCLDPNSESAKKMLAKGGDCAARAQALIEYGCRVNDRSGYNDVKDNAAEIGNVPHPCALKLQSGTWPGSNVGEFSIKLTDLRLVTDYTAIS